MSPNEENINELDFVVYIGLSGSDSINPSFNLIAYRWVLALLNLNDILQVYDVQKL